MPAHRPTGLLAIKLLALLASPFVFLWGPQLLLRRSSPLTTMWVLKVAPGPNGTAGTAAAAASSSSSPGSVNAAGAAAARRTMAAAQSESVLQTCVRDGGFYKGDWVHRPNTSKPHAHYAWGLAGKHQFVDAELAFRQARPLVPAGPGGNAQPQPPPSYLPHNQHEWEPHAPECRLSPFNRTRACLALREAAGPSRRVLFVGDSMSFQHALSLLLMLGPEGNAGRHVPRQTTWAEAPVCGDILGTPVGLHFIRNDALYVAPEPVDGWASSSRPDLAAVAHDGVDFASSKPWTPWFEAHTPGLVVLNMGLHIHGLAYFRALLDDTLAYLRGHRAAWAQQQAQAQSAAPYPRLFFRTTAPGHPDCWRYQGPVSGVEAEARANVTRFEGKYRDKFTWHLVGEFNDYLERRLGEVFEGVGNVDSVLLMRAEGITRGRPDGHLVGESKDCLHYHMPGPLDAWALTFLETLYALHGV